jgi:8-oxo-dGTP pyrophosphatase MutT (NUDIX family)
MAIESDSDEAPPPSPNAPCISKDELEEWTTPHMPILTARQLELSLREVQRRRRPQMQAPATTGAPEREAAVLVPLCTVQGTPSVLFTRRAARLSSHASQISFPGGFYDATLDPVEGSERWKHRLVDTAAREMREELRYDPRRLGAHGHFRRSGDGDEARSAARAPPPFLTIQGQTRPVPSLAGHRVTPVVGTLNYDLPAPTSARFAAAFPGNPDEVDWIFAVPLRALIAGETSEPLPRFGDADADGNGIERRERWGPVFPVPDGAEKREGDKIWGLTAIVLRPLLRRVFLPALGREQLDLGFGETEREEKVGVS